MKTDPTFSNASETSLAAATLTHEAQGERSRLSAWYSIWRHQSNNLYTVGLSIGS